MTIAFLASCTDSAYFEQNKAVKNRSWEYSEIPEFTVNITDNGAKYDIFINLRHAGGYDFSNLFVLLHQKGPQLLDTAYRKEIPLAELDGRWLGRSAGTLYEVQYLAHNDFVFPDTGVYTFALEQNMRQNPLKDVADVGIKLKKK
ncbi:MAG TPA: gliding motility lipoprotein GldH [Sphingobacterium sp.]|nr:gliding motility lipoprotein GldH [Sphingobacterium sp.]